jgi:hypothetical protein
MDQYERRRGDNPVAGERQTQSRPLVRGPHEASLRHIICRGEAMADREDGDGKPLTYRKAPVASPRWGQRAGSIEIPGHGMRHDPKESKASSRTSSQWSVDEISFDGVIERARRSEEDTPCCGLVWNGETHRGG